MSRSTLTRTLLTGAAIPMALTAATAGAQTAPPATPAPARNDPGQTGPAQNLSAQATSGQVDVAGSVAPAPQAKDSSNAAPVATDTLGDITVTARKRSESLLKVPLGITAVTAESLERRNIRDFRELSRIIPGFQFPETTTFYGQTRSNASANYVIRGLNIPGAAFLFVDGAPYANGRIDSFLNAERVEILKGPQTAYFGRNTFAGAINIVTKTPTNEWSGRVSAQAQSYGTLIGDASVEGPIIADKLLVRVAAHKDHFGGEYREAARGTRLGERNTTEFSGTIYAKPVDNMSVKVFADYTSIDDGPAYGGQLVLRTDGNCRLTPTSPLFYCGTPSVDRAVATRGVPAVYDAQFQRQIVDRFTSFGDGSFIDHIGLASRALQINGILDYDFGPVSFNTIVAHSNYRSENVGEISENSTFFPCQIAAGCGRPFGQALFYSATQAKTTSAEARLTTDQTRRLRGILGVNYVNLYNFASGSSGDLPQLPASFSNGGSLSEANTYSVFGGVTFEILSGLTLSAEGRYQWDKIHNTPSKPAATINAIQGNVGKQILDPTKDIRGTFTNFAPRLTIQYQATPRIMVFANYAKGFVPGNFNTNLRSLPSAAVALLTAAGAELNVKEQVLKQYEAGIKGSVLNGRISGSLVGYFGNVDGQQIPSASIPYNDGNAFIPLTFLSNDGKTKIRGIELEGQVVATEHLRLDGSFAWNDIEITVDRCAFCATYAGSTTADIGNRLPNVAEYTGSFSARYTDKFSGAFDWYTLADYSYRGNIFAEQLNSIRSGAANKVNVRVGLQSKQLGLEFFVENVFDDRTIPSFGLSQHYVLPSVGQSASIFTQALTIGFPDKRVFGIRANYNF